MNLHNFLITCSFFLLYLPIGTASSQEIEEINVTAQKRVASIQDVPLAITAIDGQTTKELGWISSLDIVTQTPNVAAESVYGRSSPRFFIRGIGSNDFATAQQAPVGMYVDEVFYNSTTGQGFQLFDLDRVEVLRGPQGTLWGKNTTGGAIHFITSKPSHEFDAYASVNLGLFNDDTFRKEAEGMVNGSIADGVLAGRLAAKYEALPGWITNDFDGSELGEFYSRAVRGSLLYTPNEDIDATLSITYGDQNADSAALHHEGFDGAPTDFFGYSERPGRDTISQDHQPLEDVELFSTTLTINWRIGDITLTSITGYNDVERQESQDDIADPTNTIFDRFNSDVEQWSEEIRLSSASDEKLTWIAGAYYFTEDLKGDTTFTVGPDFIGFFGGSPTGYFSSTAIEQRDRESYAFFGSFNYTYSEQWELSGGVRWTHDEEDIDINFVGFAPAAAGVRQHYFDPNSAVGGVFPFLTTSDNESWSEFTGDVTINYHWNDNTIIYGRYSHGYRGGTYNIPAFDPNEFSQVKPEFVDAFEGGLKTELLDGRLQLNLAGFLYDYTDAQVFQLQPNTLAVILSNAGELSASGFEIEYKFLPTKALFFSGGVGYTDATFDKFDNFDPVSGMTGSFAGNELPRAPEWTANILAQYTVPLANGSLKFQTDWSYQSRIFTNVNNNPFIFGSERTVGNVAVSYTTANEKWRVTAWSKNVLDDNYRTVTAGIAFAGINEVVFGDPRSFGVTFSYDY